MNYLQREAGEPGLLPDPAQTQQHSQQRRIVSTPTPTHPAYLISVLTEQHQGFKCTKFITASRLRQGFIHLFELKQ